VRGLAPLFARRAKLLGRRPDQERDHDHRRGRDRPRDRTSRA
jgi:hypothetical protein